jgi:signal transduction histidine kinase
MPRSRAQRVFQIVGLLVLVSIALQCLARGDDLPPGLPPETRWILDGVVLLCFLAFGAIFWWCTGREPARTATWKGFALLGIQAFIAFNVWTDLFFLLAAEVPFFLPPRHALRWMGIQAGITLLCGVWLLHIGGFEVTQGTEDLPRAVSVPITLASILVWQAFAFCSGYLVIHERQASDGLARANAELRATQELLAESRRLAERVQISRELHDTLGHHLTVLSLNLEIAKQVSEGKAKAAVEEAQAVTRLLLADVRGVVSDLREERGAEDPGIDLRHALETLVAGTPSPQVYLAIADGVEVRDPARGHILLRCVQEAITNAARHARARHLWIELAPDGGGIALRVRDDGRGTREVRPGNGLTGMRERVEGAGGRLEIESGLGRGLALTAWLPTPAGWA